MSDNGGPKPPADGDAPSFSVQPVTPGRRGGGRLAALALVAVLALAAGLSLVDRLGEGGPAPSTAAPSDGPGPTATRAARGSGSPPRATSPGPTPRLPEIESGSLGDAPRIVLVARNGEDATLLEWRPDEATLHPAIEVPGAFASLEENRPAGIDVRLDARLLAVHVFGSVDDAGSGMTRIVDFDGGIVWERDDLTLGAPSVWAPDGSAFAVQDGTEWLLVNLDGDVVTERRLEVPDVIPFGFSHDGRWIYGASIDDGGVVFRPAVRVDRSTGVVAPIDRYPVGSPDGIATFEGPAASVDPATGRLLPPLVPDDGGNRVVVFGPDGREPVYGHALDGLPVVLGRAWAGDGRLLVLRADARSRPTAVELVPLDSSGVRRDPLLATGPLLGASLLAGRDGHVLLALVADESEVLLVLVRAADGETAQLLLREGDLHGVVGLALAPPA